MGSVLFHVMDSSTVDIPPPPPLPRFFHFLDFFQLLYLILHLLSYRIRVLHRHIIVPLDKYLRLRHIQQVRKLFVMGGKTFECHYGVKQNINGPHPFRQWLLRTNIGSLLTPRCEEGKTLSCLDYLLLFFPPNKPIWMTLYTSQQLVKHGE